MHNAIAARKVLDDILAEREAKETSRPSGFNIGNWFTLRNTIRFMENYDGSEFVLESGTSPSVCGTTMCVAGFATLEAGYYVKIQKLPLGGFMVNWHTPDDQSINYEPDWHGVGSEYLGLEMWQSYIIFYGTRDEGKQSIAILERLAANDMPTDEEWYEYADNLCFLHNYEIYEYNAPWVEPGCDLDDELVVHIHEWQD
jgi:hypothetical protein